MSSRRSFLSLAFVTAVSLFANGRLTAQNLQESLRDIKLEDFWIYDDWESARKVAELEKRPLFVVFRCVP